MTSSPRRWCLSALLALLCVAQPLSSQQIDESPAEALEWGFRPAEGEVCERTPPPFVWRPQKGAVVYRVQVAREGEFEHPVLDREGLRWSAWCPSQALEPGSFASRFRYETAEGKASAWSRARRFSVPPGAVLFPLPEPAEIRRRLPREHPRLFLRPEQIPALRERVRGDLREPFEKLVARCRMVLKKPPDTSEPPKYPKGTVRGSPEWRRIWWGNRKRTIAVLENAANLAFAWRLGGGEEFGAASRKLLMAAAQWDPKGATSFAYNDEAGMPYCYHLSRTYTFLHDLLSEEERATCRALMQIRGGEIYDRLRRQHLWKPYNSHANRAWHFLGEAAIAFHGEIEGTAEWLEFVMTVFATVYPVWSDADGGWHEGMAYWHSYLGRFTWWADVMREAVAVDAYRLPFFSRAGDFALHVCPPGTPAGGFGDLCGRYRSERNRDLMSVLAAQAGQPRWAWYVARHGGARHSNDFIGLLRRGLPRVEPEPPEAGAASRCFRGTGVAALNATLLDAKDNVEVLFKSSPFGSWSHGYEAQNAFLLYAFGERLLIRSGRRDSYGSPHHRQWMWETRSVNSITVDGVGQRPHSAAAVGRISLFHSKGSIDYVQGEAHEAYAGGVERFSRGILFLKPDTVVIHDRLKTAKPATFQWWLHAAAPFGVEAQDHITLQAGRAACRVAILEPRDLAIEISDRFDPPPRVTPPLVEHHLSAGTPEPRDTAVFVTVLQPHRSGQAPPPAPRIEAIAGGFLLHLASATGESRVLLRASGTGPLQAEGLATPGLLAVGRFDAEGNPLEGFILDRDPGAPGR